MWSGDVHGGYPTQWALNPAAYQNMSNDEVDWASLAQQWIKMKETFPAEQVPVAPPPPAIRASAGEGGRSPSLEGGEAPMDMDTKEDNGGDSTTITPSQSQSGPGDWGNWNSWQQQWGGWQHWNTGSQGGPPAPPNISSSTKVSSTYGDGGGGGGGGGPQSGTGSGSGVTPGQIPPQYAATATDGATATTFEYNHGNSTAAGQFDQHGYWMGGGPYTRGSGSVKGGLHSSDWRSDGGVRGGPRGVRGGMLLEEDEESVGAGVAGLDAAKRKQLPAWIREGLEKMEKEKLKKLQERERLERREKEVTTDSDVHAAADVNANADNGPVNPDNTDQRTVAASKFEDSSSSNETDEESDSSVQGAAIGQRSELRRSRFDQSAGPTSISPPTHKTKEQIMQETMIKVRHVLTDILLKVTSEEITSAASEVLASMRAKAPAKQLRKTPALTSLTGKLGLGIYNSDSDGSSSSSGSQSGDEGEDHDGRSAPGKRRGGRGAVDSDEELRERVQRKKEEFARIEKEILARIEEQEERERAHMEGEKVEREGSGNRTEENDDRHCQKDDDAAERKGGGGSERERGEMTMPPLNHPHHQGVGGSVSGGGGGGNGRFDLRNTNGPQGHGTSNNSHHDHSRSHSHPSVSSSSKRDRERDRERDRQRSDSCSDSSRDRSSDSSSSRSSRSGSSGSSRSRRRNRGDRRGARSSHHRKEKRKGSRRDHRKRSVSSDRKRSSVRKLSRDRDRRRDRRKRERSRSRTRSRDRDRDSRSSYGSSRKKLPSSYSSRYNKLSSRRSRSRSRSSSSSDSPRYSRSSRSSRRRSSRDRERD